MRIYLFLTIILSTIFITSESPQVDIKDAGVGFLNEGDMALLFYITLENKCKQVYEICASMVQCCETSKPHDTNCNSMYLIGGNMGLLNSKSIKNITLIYPNLYLYNRQGMCTVKVKYYNDNMEREVTAEIDFKTITKSCSDLPNCATVDLDPMENCSPVDCVVKYSGELSFFNSRCKECQNVPMCISDPEKCVPEVAYSVPNNNCSTLSTAITKNDLQLLETMFDTSLIPDDAEECDVSLQNFVCHHGNMNNGGKCICQSDWITSTDDEIYQPTLLQYHMCNIEIGAWNCVNKGKIRTTALLISIFALTIASKILILMCILNWCYKHFKKKKRTCADRLDPFDESIIMCDTFDSFEQCLCIEPPAPAPAPAPQNKKKKGGLRSETVNVSYYPCCPSGFSSVHISSGSDKCKCSKSDETINLSNTTSSSVRVSFESISDTSIEDSDEIDEEGDYEIEFVGEGEEEEEDEEDDEEEGEGPEEEEEKCICEEEEDVKKTVCESSSAVQEESEYSASCPEGSRKCSSSSKSETASDKTLSSNKSTHSVCF